MERSSSPCEASAARQTAQETFRTLAQARVLSPTTELYLSLTGVSTHTLTDNELSKFVDEWVRDYMFVYGDPSYTCQS